MNILLIMLCITSFLYSADHEFTYAWGLSQAYPVKEYRDEIGQLTELPFQKVMNPFWLHIKSSSCCQEKKILTLIQILHALPEDHYASRRYNVAAAVYTGIDVPKLQSMKKLCSYLLLSDTVEHGDYPLTELLLKNKANPHELNDEYEKPVIYDAQQYRLAKLLIDFKALESPLNYKETLLHRAMWPDYEPRLIRLYKKYGIDPLAHADGWTPLMTLITLGIDGESYMEDDTELTKAHLLLQDLPKEKVIALITTEECSYRGPTIFDFITKEKNRSNKTERYKLDRLHTYLTNTLKSAQTAVDKSKEEESMELDLPPLGHLRSQGLDLSHRFIGIE